MQTLIFNTTTKNVKVYEGNEDSIILYNFDNTPTVKVMENHYEVYQTDAFDKRLPIARFPIAGTNMLIKQ